MERKKIIFKNQNAKSKSQFMNEQASRRYYKVFFYGNHLRGFQSSQMLFGMDRPPIFRGETKTVEMFGMTTNGDSAFVNQNDERTKICGELWEVDSRILNHIDILEGHPNWYERKLVELEIGEKAYLYFNNRSIGDIIIPDGDFRKYKDIERLKKEEEEINNSKIS